VGLVRYWRLLLRNLLRRKVLRWRCQMPAQLRRQVSKLLRRQRQHQIRLRQLVKVPAVKTPATAPAPAQTTKSVSGTFTGDSVDVRYGFVQVKITVENGKIIDAQAVQAPSGRNDRWTQRAVPILRQQTLEAQSAQITGASGASFTSYGWYTSLASALAKAGL